MIDGDHGVVAQAQLFFCCVSLIITSAYRAVSVRTSKLCTLLLLSLVEAMKPKLNGLVGWYLGIAMHKSEPPELYNVGNERLIVNPSVYLFLYRVILQTLFGCPDLLL
jgi:hypothetical protein